MPKTRIYTAGQPGRRLREKIAQQIARIVWQYKLAPETLNLTASRAVPEIQVFTLALKPEGITDEVPEDIKPASIARNSSTARSSSTGSCVSFMRSLQPLEGVVKPVAGTWVFSKQ